MVTIEQVLAAMPWGGPCCDEDEDVQTLILWIGNRLNLSQAERRRARLALYGEPWATDDDNDRRQIAETVCKVLNRGEG